MADDKKQQVTKIKILVPKGKSVEDVLSKLELSFEQVEPDPHEINQDVCCVDVALVSPVSTVSHH